MDLILATKNIHKIRELRALLKKVKQLEIYSLIDFPDYTPPPENGKSFEEIATLKATHAAKSLGKWALADDSGLVVPALQGAPGIFSSRFAGEQATDRDNRLKLLSLMSKLEESQRSAYFACSLACASPDGQCKTVSGLCEGRILTEERGSQGFGYDPLFVKFEYSKSFAELDEETKNRISHRRKAMDKLLPYLEGVAKLPL